MHKQSMLVLVLVCVFMVSVGVEAANVGGEFVGELRILTKEDKPINNAIATLGTKIDIDGDLGDAGSWKLVLDVSLDEALNNFRSNIWDADDTDAAGESITLELDEAYLNLYSVGGEAIDVRLGKQYVDMGVGDGITTFNLTRPVAANYVDELQNTRAVTGVKVDGYPEDFHVEVFLQPRVTPNKTGGRLESVYSKAQQEAMAPMLEAMNKPANVLETGFIIGDIGLDENPPAYDDEGLGLTLKASRLVGDYDLGVIYQRGYGPNPLISGYGIDQEPIDFDTSLGEPIPVMRLRLQQGYLPLQKVGFTVEGTLGDAGIWGELTYNIPKEGFFAEAMASELLPEEYRLTDEKYVTGLVGMDYFFDNGVYVNGQLIRGFPQEVTKSMLNTYLAGDIYQDFLNNRLRLEGRAVYCFGDKGWMLLPEAAYQVNSNTKVIGKLAIPGGDDKSLFRQMEDLTQILIGVSVSF